MQKALHVSLVSVSGLIGIGLIEPDHVRTITDRSCVVREGVSCVDELALRQRLKPTPYCELELLIGRALVEANLTAYEKILVD